MYETLRGYEVPWRQAELVHRQTEGNPLFVQEVLRYFVEEGIVVREQGTYVVRGDATAIPDGLRDVIGRRLSHLDEKTNTVLSIAAVIGRDFRLNVLQKVAGLPEEDLYSALEQASEHAIVEQRPAPAGVAFRFTHAMFRTLLYEEIFAPRRIRLHQQVGRALEEVYARRLEEHAAELAEHFLQSTEAADLEKAVRYGQLAAQRAMGVFAYGEAVRHLEQALRAQEILDPDDMAKRCDLYLALGDALLPSGDPLRAMEFGAKNALEAAEALGDERRAWEACRIGLDGGFIYEPGVIGGKWSEWLYRAEKYAEVTKEATVRFYRAKSVELNQSGQGSEAVRLIEHAMEIARGLDNPDAQYSCAWMLMNAYFTETQSHKRLQLAEEFSTRSRTGVSTLNLAQVLDLAADTFRSFGNRARWEELVSDLDRLGTDTRYARVTTLALRQRCQMAMIDGRLLDAVSLATSLVEHLEAAHVGIAGSEWLFAQMHKYRLATWLGSSEDFALPSGPDFGFGAWAILLHHRGQDEEARSALHRAQESSRQQWMQGVALGPLSMRLEAAVLLGDRETTAELAPLLDPSRGRLVQSVGAIARVLGDAAKLLDKPNEARAYYEEAIEVCAAFRYRPELALSHLELAEVLLEHYPDERDAAIEHLDFAISEFREMKMRPALERALRHRGLLKA
jgi:tetratricopeptide (TPR) repeat protein